MHERDHWVQVSQQKGLNNNYYNAYFARKTSGKSCKLRTKSGSPYSARTLVALCPRRMFRARPYWTPNERHVIAGVMLTVTYGLSTCQAGLAWRRPVTFSIWQGSRQYSMSHRGNRLCMGSSASGKCSDMWRVGQQLTCALQRTIFEEDLVKTTPDGHTRVERRVLANQASFSAKAVIPINRP